MEGGESGRKDEGVRLGGGEGMPRGRERERVGEGEGEGGGGGGGAVTAHIQRDAPLHIHQAVAN